MAVSNKGPDAAEPQPQKSGDGAPSNKENRDTPILVGAGSVRRSRMRARRSDPTDEDAKACFAFLVLTAGVRGRCRQIVNLCNKKSSVPKTGCAEIPILDFFRESP